MAKIVGVLFKNEGEEVYDEQDFDRCLSNARSFCDEIYVEGKNPKSHDLKNTYFLDNIQNVYGMAWNRDVDFLVRLNSKYVFSKIGVRGGVRSICEIMKRRRLMRYLERDGTYINVPAKRLKCVLFHVMQLWGSHNLARADKGFYSVWLPLLIRCETGLTFENVPVEPSAHAPIEILSFLFENEGVPEEKKGFKLYPVPYQFYYAELLNFIEQKKIFPDELIEFVDGERLDEYPTPYAWMELVKKYDRTELRRSEDWERMLKG